MAGPISTAQKGWRGQDQDSGLFQFIMYGLVGFIPGTLSVFRAHKFVEEPLAQGRPPREERRAETARRALIVCD